ncbi:MAG: hypothetical protein ACRD0H_18410, partial [Actinomycetes bacterium]
WVARLTQRAGRYRAGRRPTRPHTAAVDPDHATHTGGLCAGIAAPRRVPVPVGHCDAVAVHRTGLHPPTRDLSTPIERFKYRAARRYWQR